MKRFLPDWRLLLIGLIVLVVALVPLTKPKPAHNKTGMGHPGSAYVARADIRAGTPAETIIARGMIETRTVDLLATPPEAIRSLDDIEGEWADVKIPKGATLLRTDFIALSRPNRSR